ncbi:GGDEF domain-containing protein [Wenzhouxiangella sp. EGI_FJ10409]|uniref:GGDEF domain-containing protein n=1 Tax=Wenzhouxiangella sp. EGI_FJ10409 TaxID=3243767 RepID=UPI0035DAE1F6
MILPSIDIPTLAVARAIIQLTLAGLVVWTGNRQEQRSGTHWWAWGLALHGLGLLIFTVIIEHGLLDSLMTAANHLSFGLSSACILFGFWRFADRPVRWWLIVLIIGIPVVSLLAWEWWYPNARWRIVTTASGQVIFLIALFAVLAKPPRREMAGIYGALRWITGAYLPLLVWSYGSAMELLPTTARIPAAYHGVTFSVGSMLFMLALAVGFLALQYSLLACRHADQARRDWLTGLLNRRGIMEVVEGWADDYGQRPTFKVMALDIDHFKSINDRYGHEVGDFVLERLAGELNRQAGPDAVVGRMGGEEFLVLLPDSDEQVVFRRAEGLRRAIARFGVELPDGVIRATVSIGYAAGRQGESLEAVLRRADAALYRAKEQGRNRVVAAASVDRPAEGA